MDHPIFNQPLRVKRHWTLVVVALTISVGGYDLAVVSGSAFWISAVAILICGGQLALGSTLLKRSTGVDAPTANQIPPQAIRSVATRLISAIQSLARHRDPVLIELSVLRLAELAAAAEALAKGCLVFENTETWRAAYEKLLCVPGIDRYRSVAWVRSDDYWQDLPGKRSMQLNVDLANRGLLIERIVILGSNLWPPAARLPLATTRRWIEKQHDRGLKISLVREADLVNEPDLICDFGIYGTRATGSQELDSHSRTLQFQLFFDEVSLRQAEDRWNRLTVFARPYGTLLDPPGHAA